MASEELVLGEKATHRSLSELEELGALAGVAEKMYCSQGRHDPEE